MGAPNTGKLTSGLAVVVFSLILSGCENAKDLPLLTRYVAKNLCTAQWVEGYDPAAARAYVSNIAPVISSSWLTQQDDRSVTASNRWFPWVAPKTANLVQSGSSTECRNEYPSVETWQNDLSVVPALDAGFVTDVESESALQMYLESVVGVGAPEHTTALFVLHGNRVIAEAYRDGIGPQSSLKGFSMSKSFANLLLGRMFDRGLMNIHDSLPLAEWSQDERAFITWHDVMRMSSGLDWNEAATGENNDQGQMLYNAESPSLYAKEKTIIEPSGSLFNYSSGDYMNLSTAMVEKTEAWFDPGWNLGGHYALEFSPNGQYPLLAEGVLLTTRGWAALASIYMQGGQLAGRQVLSEQWVEYSLNPSATNYDYGAGVWLNLGQNFFPELPRDTFVFAGSYDRYVVAIPSLDLVFVRMGFSSQPGDFDMQRFIVNAMELVQ